MPWDKVDDHAALARHARDLGVGIEAINSNVFEDDYVLGSVTLEGSSDPACISPGTDIVLELSCEALGQETPVGLRQIMAHRHWRFGGCVLRMQERARHPISVRAAHTHPVGGDG